MSNSINTAVNGVNGNGNGTGNGNETNVPKEEPQPIQLSPPPQQPLNPQCTQFEPNEIMSWVEGVSFALVIIFIAGTLFSEDTIITGMLRVVFILALVTMAAVQVINRHKDTPIGNSVGLVKAGVILLLLIVLVSRPRLGVPPAPKNIRQKN